MTGSLPRLIDKAVWSFNPDGSVMDVAAPNEAAVCFLEIGAALAKVPRFNARHPGAPFSVAQHLVMGAKAIINEGGSSRLAALYLMHRAHEWAIGDIVRSTERLLAGLLASLAVPAALNHAKSSWDDVIYAAAGLPLPGQWTAKDKKLVRSMDDRMCAAEAIFLFGIRAASQFPKTDIEAKPRTTGTFRPWGPAQAEEQFREALYRWIGEDIITHQASVAAAARELLK